mmetsp:Transcript_14309/g.38946  ORF Transcript_14309/g.38946 Transcript_14309/m.38946 type:complete len:210 (+) Transcript_14309:1765-2394(+)
MSKQLFPSSVGEKRTNILHSSSTTTTRGVGHPCSRPPMLSQLMKHQRICRSVDDLFLPQRSHGPIRGLETLALVHHKTSSPRLRGEALGAFLKILHCVHAHLEPTLVRITENELGQVTPEHRPQEVLQFSIPSQRIHNKHLRSIGWLEGELDQGHRARNTSTVWLPLDVDSNGTRTSTRSTKLLRQMVDESNATHDSCKWPAQTKFYQR